jgi:hypothetical protein
MSPGLSMTTWFLVLLMACDAGQSGPRSQDAEAIDRARTASVRDIDRDLPDRPLAAWLTDLFGPSATVAWEVNDCGEQTGDPGTDRDRDFPMCAEASVSLGGGRVLVFLLDVGTFRTGVRREAPTFRYGYLLEGDHPAPARWLKSLAEVADGRTQPESPRPARRTRWSPITMQGP